MSKEMTAVPIEKQILSALIWMKPDLVSTMKAEGIDAGDFTDHVCRKIYDRICNHGETDLLTLTNALPELEKEILDIEAAAVTTVSFPEWCRDLKEYTARRKIIEECLKLISKAEDRQTPFLEGLKTATTAFLEQQNRIEIRRSLDAPEAFREYRQMMDQGGCSADAVRYGFRLDNYLHHFKGEIFTLGAAPGTGKTAFALSAMLNMAQENLKVALFCQEMPSRILFARLVSNLATVPLGDILSGRKRDECQKAEDVIQKLLDQRKILIRGNGEYRHSVAGIGAEIQRFYNEAGALDWFCVDYVQTLRADSKVRDRRDEIDAAVEGIKQLAGEYHAACLLLSQLSRSGQQGGEIGMTALKESAHIEEISSIIAFLKKKTDDGGISFQVKKTRNSGRIFNGTLLFQSEYMRFSEHAYSEADARFSEDRQKSFTGHNK